LTANWFLTHGSGNAIIHNKQNNPQRSNIQTAAMKRAIMNTP
jgi:hypothetical protein